MRTRHFSGVDALVEALLVEDPARHGLGVHRAERGEGAPGHPLRAALRHGGPRLAAVHARVGLEAAAAVRRPKSFLTLILTRLERKS